MKIVFKYPVCFCHGLDWKQSVFICLESDCSRLVCENCFGSVDGEHFNHQVIHAQRFLERVQRELLTDRLGRVLNEIMKLKRMRKGNRIKFQFESEIRQVIGLENQQYYSYYQTRLILNFGLKLLGKSENFNRIKLPQSLDISPFDFEFLSTQQTIFQEEEQMNNWLFDLNDLKWNPYLINRPFISLPRMRNKNHLNFQSKMIGDDPNKKTNKNGDLLLDFQKAVVLDSAHVGEIFNVVDLSGGYGNSIHLIATIGSDEMLRFWDTRVFECKKVLKIQLTTDPLSQPVQSDLHFMKRINCVAVLGVSCVALVNVRTYKIIRRVWIQADNITSCDENNLMYLVEYPHRKGVIEYNMISGLITQKLKWEHDEIYSFTIAKSKRNKALVVGDKSGKIQCFEVNGLKCIGEINLQGKKVYSFETVNLGLTVIGFFMNTAETSTDIIMINVDTFQIVSSIEMPASFSAISYADSIYLIQEKNVLTEIAIEGQERLKQGKQTRIMSSRKHGLNNSPQFSSARVLSFSKCIFLTEFYEDTNQSHFMFIPFIHSHV